jgi:hypothetical protein
MRRDATIRQRLGTALAAASAFAAAWTAVVLLSGGVTIHTAVSVIASRGPLRPLAIAVVLGGAAWALLGTRHSLRILRDVAGYPDHTAVRVAMVTTACTLVVSIAWNTRAAGGSDSSCYVLQAEAFAHGRATLSSPLAAAPPIVPPVALAPTGFVPSAAPPYGAVPICAPGLALVMVPAFFVSRDAVFLIVAGFAALAVWCTFLLGRALHGDVAGACAAVLLACSPIFLYQSVQPMSDVPATAMWLAALVLLGTSSRAFAAGICASMAVLMRPNMALIVLPLFALRPSSWLRFGAAGVPALAVMLALNAARYGSPLSSGYGDTGVLFSAAHILPNLARYPRWLFDTHTPFVALAVIAPFLPWRREQRRLVFVAAAAIVLTIATYLAYTVFDDWWYIRFLLPALPAVLVFAIVVAVRAGERFAPGRPRLTIAGISVVTIVLSGWFLHVARTRAAFDLVTLESRFRVAGEYAGRALTDEAIVLAVQQSGSVRYYGGRGTLAWDGIPPERLDATIAALEKAGRRVFLVLEEGEEGRFRARFARQQAGGLDWPPFAEVPGPPRVRFYDPRQRERYRAGERYTVEVVAGRSGARARR